METLLDRGLEDPRPRLDAIDMQRTRDCVVQRLFDRAPCRVEVDRFLIVGNAGAGAMGRVYVAYDPVLDRKVAVKMIAAAEDDEGDALRRAHLIREARALAQVEHPHVVRVFETGIVDDEVFVTMEYVAGGTLQDWMARGPHPWSTALPVLLCAGRGLAAAHAAGIVHRDFKPNNVLLGDGIVKVADFGLAYTPSATSEVSGDSDGSGSRPRIAGTPAYMAPEQRFGGPIDARTDQFAFCVVLFEALHGRRPSQRAVVPAPQLPIRLVRALDRGLCALPAQRFAHMSELLSELEHVLRGPSTRTRRIVLAAAAVLVVGGSSWALGAGSVDVCDHGDEALAGVWDEDARVHTRSVIEGSAAAFAHDVGPGVEHVLDEYAHGWEAAHADACEATHVRHEQSSDALDLRMACLHERRHALSTLVDLLATGDAEVLARASDAVARLPDLAACADASALRDQAPSAVEPELVAEVAEIRNELARVRTLVDAGRQDDAARLAVELADRARRTGHSPVVVEAAVELGDALEKQGDYETAARTWSDAYPDAVANHQDDLALRIATELVFVAGERLAREDESGRWARVAAAWLQRTGRRDTAVAADLHNNVGAAALRMGDFARALAEYERALALRERWLAADDLRIARAVSNVGRARESLGEFASACRDHQRAVRIAEAAVGAEHPLVAELLVNLATSVELAGDPEGALVHLHRAESIQARSLGAWHPRYAATLESLAITHRALGHHSEAIGHMARVLEIRRASLGHEHPEVAGALVNIAVLEDEAGEHERAVTHYEEALNTLRRAFGDDHPHVVIALHDQALALSELGRNEEAHERISRALAIAEASLGPKHPEVAGILDDTGMVLARMGHIDDALGLHRRALAIYEGTVGGEHFEVAITRAYLGEAHRARGEYEAAIVEFERALEIGERARGADHPALASPLLGLARVELSRDRPRDAVAHAQRAVDLREHGDVDEDARREAAEVLATARSRASHSRRR